jgi:hypothetical protein
MKVGWWDFKISGKSFGGLKKLVLYLHSQTEA